MGAGNITTGCGCREGSIRRGDDFEDGDGNSESRFRLGATDTVIGTGAGAGAAGRGRISLGFDRRGDSLTLSCINRVGRLTCVEQEGKSGKVQITRNKSERQ